MRPGGWGCTRPEPGGRGEAVEAGRGSLRGLAPQTLLLPPLAPRRHDSLSLGGRGRWGAVQFSPWYITPGVLPPGSMFSASRVGKKRVARLRCTGCGAAAWRDGRLLRVTSTRWSRDLRFEALKGLCPWPAAPAMGADPGVLPVFFSVLSKSIARSRPALLTDSCGAWHAFTVRAHAGFPVPVLPGRWLAFPPSRGRAAAVLPPARPRA